MTTASTSLRVHNIYFQQVLQSLVRPTLERDMKPSITRNRTIVSQTFADTLCVLH